MKKQLDRFHLPYYLCFENFSKEQYDDDLSSVILDQKPLEDEELSQQNINIFFRQLLNFKENQIENLEIFDENRWQYILKSFSCSDLQKNILRDNCLYGLPNDYRASIWLWMINLKDFKKQYPPGIFYKLKTQSNPNQDQINKDVNRTFSHEPFLKEESVQKYFSEILIAYCNFDPDIGYTQGMSYIVGLLILAMKKQKFQNFYASENIIEYTEEEIQENIFWVFIYIQFEKNQREVFREGLKEMQDLIKNLEQKIKKELPKLYESLKSLDSFYYIVCFCEDYITILSYYAPQKIQERILELFLLEGQNIIDEILIQLMKQCENKLIAFKKVDDLVQFLKKDILIYAYRDCLKQNKRDFPFNEQKVIL